MARWQRGPGDFPTAGAAMVTISRHSVIIGRPTSR
jgi:hypothetical protein